MLKKFSAVMSAALLAACASPLSGEYASGKGKTMVVTKEVWGYYQDYMSKISGVNKGIFVAGVLDGEAITAVYYYCPGTKCIVENVSRKAMADCVGQATGYNFGTRYECVLFAQSGRILVNYKLSEG
jgi:hypothetical protein